MLVLKVLIQRNGYYRLFWQLFGDKIGKQTPKGPNYNVTDKFSYSKGPEWKIGTQMRNTLDIKAKFEHYFRKDIDLDINEADKGNRFKNGNTRFYGASRFPLQEKKYQMTPGPEYNPPIKPEATELPKYSLYARRAVKGFDPLIQLNSTSEIVGPGSCNPQNSANPSNKLNFPNWSIPKGPRDPTHQLRVQLNQTYDTTSSVGLQQRSDKTTKPIFSIGKQKRGQKRSGIFKAHMEFKPMQVRLEHPHLDLYIIAVCQMILEELRKSVLVLGEHIKQFSKVVGDNNPVHLKQQFAAQTRFKSPIAHGMLGVSHIAQLIPKKYSLQNMHIKFTKPIYPNTNIHIYLLIRQNLQLESTITNDENQVVTKMTGTVLEQ